MAIETKRVTVHLAGAANNKTGEAWVFRLYGGAESKVVYATSQAAMKAGERALKRAR